MPNYFLQQENGSYVLQQDLSKLIIGTSPCEVLMLANNGGVYSYNYGNNTSTFLTQSIGGSDIAMTDTKMWVNAGAFYEYDITLSPFSASFNRVIAYSSSVANGAGLVAKDNNTLVIGGATLAQVDITGATGSYTTLFTLPTSGSYTGSISGDMYYNSTSDTYIATYNQYNGVFSTGYVAEFDATGGILNRTALTFTDGYGVFSSGSSVYIARGTGELYQIDTSSFAVNYTQTLTLSGSLQVFGSAQSPECSTVYIPPASPSPSPSISPTPSITPTISTTATVSVTPTISPSTTISATPSITPSITRTPSITPSLTPTPTITPSPSPKRNEPTTGSIPYDLGLTAETTIYVNEVKCRVSENDFNYSQNPTVFKYGTTISGSGSIPFYAPIGGISTWGETTDGTLADNVTGSSFHPYATTVGLYNDAGQLLVVGKLGTPYPIPSNTDITFIVRWDS